MKFDGVLLVDKPGGMTSHDVVGRLRRLLKRKDIGHAGTLDPLATGLLVILIGKATKLSDYLLNGDKAYRTTVRLGVETDTDDMDGEVTKESPLNHSLMELEEKALQLSGKLTLKVPIYSAIKVKGKKLYEKAREGEDFTPPVRPMEFRDLKIEDLTQEKITLSFACSKGSYVRAWAKTLGENLGCGATVQLLRRIKSEPYLVENAIKLEKLEELGGENLPSLEGFIPLNQCLPDWPSLKVEGLDEKLVLNGQIPRRLERYMELEFSGIEGLQGVKLLSKRQNQLIALLEFQAPLGFKIRRVFPNQ